MNDTEQIRAEIDSAITRCLDRGWTPELLLHVFRRERDGACQVLAAVLDGRRFEPDASAHFVLALLRSLGPLPGGVSAREDGGLDAKIVDRVRGLLAKAESTTFEAALNEAFPSTRSLRVQGSSSDGFAAGRDAADRAALGGATLRGPCPGIPAG